MTSPEIITPVVSSSDNVLSFAANSAMSVLVGLRDQQRTLNALFADDDDRLPGAEVDIWSYYGMTGDLPNSGTWGISIRFPDTRNLATRLSGAPCPDDQTVYSLMVKDENGTRRNATNEEKETVAYALSLVHDNDFHGEVVSASKVGRITRALGTIARAISCK